MKVRSPTTSMRRLEGALDAMSGLDWTDLMAVDVAFRRASTDLCHPSSLGLLLTNVRNNDHLLSLSERRVWGDRIVLADDLEERGFRIRLHHWTEATEDPHNHRWAFAARIVDGSYLHASYGLESNLRDRIGEGPIAPHQVRTERPGNVYCLSDDMVHLTRPLHGALSIVVRGPAVRVANIMIDRSTGDVSLTKYGSQDETARQRAAVATSVARIDDVIHELVARSLVVPPPSKHTISSRL